MKLKVSILLIILCVIPFYAFAQDSSEEPETGTETAAESEFLLNLDDADDAGSPAVPAASSAGGIIRAIVIFIIILALIFGFFLVLKKVSGNKFQNNNMINIVSSQGLAGSKALHLVEVAGEVYLVGAADNGISLISRIDNKEARDQIRMEMSKEKPVQKNSFRDILNSVFSRQGHSTGKTEGSADFIRQQGDRLKKL